MENPEKPVAPGLQVKAVVEYYPESEEDLEDRLLLLIEEDVVDIPLLGYGGQKFIFCCYCFQFNLVENLLTPVTYGYITKLSTVMKMNSKFLYNFFSHSSAQVRRQLGWWCSKILERL